MVALLPGDKPVQVVFASEKFVPQAPPILKFVHGPTPATSANFCAITNAASLLVAVAKTKLVHKIRLELSGINEVAQPVD